MPYIFDKQRYGIKLSNRIYINPFLSTRKHNSKRLSILQFTGPFNRD